MTSKPRAAIFDLDGTVIDCSSERVFVGYLVREGVVTWRDMARWLNLALRGLPKGINSALRGNRSYLAGKPEALIREMAEIFVEKCLVDRIARQALAEAQMHRSQGDILVLLSGSIQPLVEPVGRALNVDLVQASELESREGILTGRLSSLHPSGKNKARVAEMLAQRQDFDLSQSVAYADLLSDLPLLNRVGVPVAVNPERALRRYARQHGWRIVNWHS